MTQRVDDRFPADQKNFFLDCRVQCPRLSLNENLNSRTPGRCDFRHQVRKVLLDLLKDKKSPRVIVNLEKVRYIDSAGVASLVEGLKVSRDMKSTFAMFGLSRTARHRAHLAAPARIRT